MIRICLMVPYNCFNQLKTINKINERKPDKNLLNGSIVFRLGRIQRGSDVEVDGRSFLFSGSEHRMLLPFDAEHLDVELVAVVIVLVDVRRFGVRRFGFRFRRFVDFRVVVFRYSFVQFARLKEFQNKTNG